MAKYAGQNVHKRLITEESYKEQNWEMALKRAFLGTDEDLLASTSILDFVIIERFTPWERSCTYEGSIRMYCRCCAHNK